MADSGQKTEQPSQRRLDKSRDEGQFPTSREFVASVQFAAFVFLLASRAPDWFEASRRWMRHLLVAAFRADFTYATTERLLHTLAAEIALPMLSIGAVIAAITLATQLALTRLGFATSRLAPDLSRLNPAGRLKQMPQQNLQQFFQSLFLLPLFCLAVYMVARQSLEQFLRLPRAGLESALRMIAGSLESLLWQAAGLFLLIGVIDLIRQRRRWMAQLRMSKQDLREEHKEAEGDPHIKMRLRQLRRALLRRNMMKAVDTATAVIVNPTHFAVALRYTPDSMHAPKVVAKGKNYLALRIRDRAIRNQVPIVENPPLAQALYKSAHVGQDIPMHLYRAVAEVLAYIYRLTSPLRPGHGP